MDQATMACSMSIIVRRGAELLREKRLRPARDDELAGNDAGRQNPAARLAAEGLHFAALESSWGDADIHQGPSLVVEERGFRDRNGLPGIGLWHLHERFDKKAWTPDSTALLDLCFAFT